MARIYLFSAMISAIVVAETTTRYSPWEIKFRSDSRRQRRAQLDTRFMDIARSAITSLACEKDFKPNNKLYHAIDEIEQALAKMQAQKGNPAFDEKDAEEFMFFLRRTAKFGHIESFREALSRAMFHNMSLSSMNERNAGLRTEEMRAMLKGAKAFLSEMKQQIGRERFEELITINGEVTLVFVIDSTGSMKEDIDAAKTIAQEIIVHDREVPVSFVLSTFSDPDVAPIVYHDERNLKKAISAIGNITVNGGGDCPEMAFQGLLQALYYSPLPGSALYVFTDAYAKDNTRENIETVTALAIDLGISIYFFTSGDCGGHTSEMESFRSVAQATGGLMFPLHSSDEIKKLSKFVKQNLKGVATVDSNTANEASAKSYTIVVDDTIKTLVLSVIMSKMDINVRLISSKGVMQYVTSKLDMIVIFDLENPTPGNWTLVVPSAAGDIEYLVRTISKLNIDFSHYYFKYLPKTTSTDHVPVVHPLLGEDVMVMITVFEVHQIETKSLHLNVIYKDGTYGGRFKMHPVGESGVRFRAKMIVKRGPYKLQLVGKTKLGHQFTRLAQAFDEAKPFRLRVVYASRYTLPIGKTVELLLAIDNPAAESYTFDVTDSFGYVVDVKRQGSYKLNTARSNFELTLHVPSNATMHINKINRVVIKAIGQKTGVVSTEIVRLLVTPKNLDN